MSVIFEEEEVGAEFYEDPNKKSKSKLVTWLVERGIFKQAQTAEVVLIIISLIFFLSSIGILLFKKGASVEAPSGEYYYVDDIEESVFVPDGMTLEEVVNLQLQ